MKKKSSFAVLAAILVMAVTLSTLVTPSFARRKLGDVDGDGFITSADARIALRASVKLDKLSPEEALAADVDGDTFVTSADARSILRASVKLDILPDVSVGDDTGTPTDATPTDATPTDPEPTEPTTEPVTEPETTTEPTTEPETTTEPEKPTEPETTTEPEKPSEPETTTEPEKPTEPETTTEPEKPTEPQPPSDIIPPAENNEYDILRSGNYYFKGYTVDADGKSDLEIAKTADSLFLCSEFSGVKIAILTIGDKVYLVNPAKNVYLDLNNSIMKAELNAVGVDINDFANTSSFDFSYFPPLDQATRSEEVPGGYVRYVFETEAGAINVTMDGKRLMSLENARNGSVYRIDFTSVPGDVPSEKRELTNLQKRTQTLFIASLMS